MELIWIFWAFLSFLFSEVWITLCCINHRPSNLLNNKTTWKNIVIVLLDQATHKYKKNPIRWELMWSDRDSPRGMESMPTQKVWKPRSHLSQNIISSSWWGCSQTVHVLHSMHCHGYILIWDTKSTLISRQDGWPVHKTSLSQDLYGHAYKWDVLSTSWLSGCWHLGNTTAQITLSIKENVFGVIVWLTAVLALGAVDKGFWFASLVGLLTLLTYATYSIGNDLRLQGQSNAINAMATKVIW